MADKSYYEIIKDKLIEKYKVVIEQCLEVIENEIGDNITDDKLHAVLKAKRMAAEDAKYYAKEIETLENEAKGIDNEEKETRKKGPEGFAKK